MNKDCSWSQLQFVVAEEMKKTKHPWLKVVDVESDDFYHAPVGHLRNDGGKMASKYSSYFGSRWIKDDGFGNNKERTEPPLDKKPNPSRWLSKKYKLPQKSKKEKEKEKLEKAKKRKQLLARGPTDC